MNALAESGYFKRVFSRAWTMTLADVGLERPRQVFAKLFWSVVTFVILWVFGAVDQLVSDLGRWGASGLAFAFLLAFFYLVNVARAAAAMQSEADAIAADLRKQIDDREARQAAVNALWELRSNGIAHRNERVFYDDDFAAWRATFEEWRNNTLQEAEKVNVNLKHYLDLLDRMQPGPQDILVHAVHPEHARLIEIMSEILTRLQAFLTKDLHA